MWLFLKELWVSLQCLFIVAHCVYVCVLGVFVWSLVCYAVLGFLSSFALILMRKREFVALTLIVSLVFCDCKCSVALPHGATV